MAKKKNTLLADAIADAKAVRETALANAKVALEEAFTPHLTSMLSARLRNESEDFDDDDELDELNDPIPSADGYGSDEGGETDIEAVEKSSFTEAAVDVGSGVGSDGEKLKSSDIGTGPENEYGDMNAKEPSQATRSSSNIANDDKLGMNEDFDEFDDEEDDGMMMAADEVPGDDGAELDFAPEMGGQDDLGGDEFGDDPMNGGMGGDPMAGGDMGGGEFGGEEEPEDLDLEAIIRELEADMVAPEDEFEAPVGDDGMEEDPYALGEEVDLPSAADGHGSDEGGETDNEAIRKKSFTQGMGQKQTGPISESDDNDEDDGEIDLEEILREIEDEESSDELETENTELKGELKEYRDAVRFLRSKLNEVNLLNAKLLYTNKLFKNYNMDGRQKLRVVENFDRAGTVREAKLVFATLAESFKGKPITRKRSITEGLASKRTGSTRSRRKVENTSTEDVPTILAEGTQLAARFKKLAGIDTK